MTRMEAANPVHVVQAINEHRGCPVTMPRATAMGSRPVSEMTADERKQEYYFLLDGVLEEVVGNVREFRRDYPHGLVKRGEDGQLVSALPDMRARVAPHVAAGDFVSATYWVHDAIYGSIDLATEKWLAEADTSSPAYQRINSLVDDPRQAAYGGVAIQKRVSSAANQTVHISCSMQRMTDALYPETYGRKATPADMSAAHAGNLRFAMPMTNFHLLETRPIRAVLGSETMPGGHIEMYSHPEFFALEDGVLHPNGMRMAERMSDYGGAFPDGRIGCPGLKYIPEIWDWAGQLSEEFAMPALAPAEYDFSVPGIIPH